MSTVLLYADEPILAVGLRRILEDVDGLELVYVSHNLDDLGDQLKLFRPDILLLDLTAEITFGVLCDLRETDASTKIVLWVHGISTEMALQSVSLGVRGILRHTMGVETLVNCLTCVSQGQLWFDKALTDSLLTTTRHSLTRREGQLVALISQGLKNKEIAHQMDVSEGTVKVYMSRLFQKLGVNDRFELALYGLKNLAPNARVAEATSVSAAKRRAALPEQPPRLFFMERAAAAGQGGSVSKK
jgi:DNA-binding NarL/FixJ family response regulator